MCIPIEQAIAQVITLHNAEVRSFIVLAQHLPRFTQAIDRALARYVAGMQYWMRANLERLRGPTPESASLAAATPAEVYSL